MPSSTSLNYARTHFILSAPDITYLPKDSGIEIAFAGRSNAGKSSALNTLAQQKSLARTSKTPGRTQLINLFEVEPECRIVDLPGYGYAKVPEAVKRKWQKALWKYLQKRQSLKGMVILMDIRHPLTDLDQKMIEWSVSVDLPVLLLLTKSDKLSTFAQKKQLQLVLAATLPFHADIEVELFSAVKKQGLAQLKSKLNMWYLPELKITNGASNEGTYGM